MVDGFKILCMDGRISTVLFVMHLKANGQSVNYSLYNRYSKKKTVKTLGGSFVSMAAHHHLMLTGYCTLFFSEFNKHCLY